MSTLMSCLLGKLRRRARRAFGRVDEVVVGVVGGGGAERALFGPSLATRSTNERKPNSANSSASASLVDAADAAGVPIGRDRHLGIEPHELARKQCLLAAFEEFLALCAGHLGGVLEQVVERAVGFEQLLGRLGADAGDAGHVVDLVAHERLEVDDLVGPDAPVVAKRGRVEDLILADVEDGHAIGDELPAVLVARDDEAVGAAFVADPGDAWPARRRPRNPGR